MAPGKSTPIRASTSVNVLAAGQSSQTEPAPQSILGRAIPNQISATIRRQIARAATTQKPSPTSSSRDKIDSNPPDRPTDHVANSLLTKNSRTQPGPLTTGTCMCCMSSLRYPSSITCFRCTVCQTTNDLVTSAGHRKQEETQSLSLSFIKQAERLDSLLATAFSSHNILNRSFGNGKKFSFSDSGINLAEVEEFYAYILSREDASALVKVLVKSSEGLLKRPGKPISSPEDLRFLLVILSNPVLHSSSKYSHITVTGTTSSDTSRPSSVLKRLLGIISTLNNSCHHYLVNWFARLPASSFSSKVELINSFLTHRLSKYCLLGQERKHGDSTIARLEHYGSDWRVRAAARTLALFFAANIQSPKVPISSFYNTLVDYTDITHDFDVWEKQGIPSLNSGPKQNHALGEPTACKESKSLSSLKPNSSLPTTFTFCQYPFFLSMGSKISILEYDARRQMEIKAREAFFSTISQKRIVQPHLILKVRRECIIEDSLRQISSNEMELKKGLKIEFLGEDGVDAGGLRKEWFLLLVRDVFDPMNGMFTYDEESHYCWFNNSTFETSDQYFLVGVVLGLAMYNSTILDIRLPPAVFKKLLGCQCTFEDLKLLRPGLAKGLQQLLDFDGNVQETYCRDFVAEYDNYGSITQTPLIPDGENTPVTNSNRQDFVNRYVQFIFESSVRRQFQPFKRGFYHVIGGNALTLFRPEEIELLVRGSDEGLDVAALRAVAIYDGWSKKPRASAHTHNSREPDGISRGHDLGNQGLPERTAVRNRSGSEILPQTIEENEPVIRWFWEYFERIENREQRRLLAFVTGSDRIPATGTANLIFKISKMGEDCDRYPTSHTCFNQLCLYRYASREKLEDKLCRAMMESEGFGLR
ncbi:uncharacterized protein V1510DRAFT_410368 [Dipodascopsis tothii]|uniref:uncharacterized protein n=1 Tax=Dipodascopsis tothii TaxID=44089 RepID=UPI0034CE6595